MHAVGSREQQQAFGKQEIVFFFNWVVTDMSWYSANDGSCLGGTIFKMCMVVDAKGNLCIKTDYTAGTEFWHNRFLYFSSYT